MANSLSGSTAHPSEERVFLRYFFTWNDTIRKFVNYPLRKYRSSLYCLDVINKVQIKCTYNNNKVFTTMIAIDFLKIFDIDENVRNGKEESQFL